MSLALDEWEPRGGLDRAGPAVQNWLNALAQAGCEEELWGLLKLQDRPTTRVECQQMRGLLIKVLHEKFGQFGSKASPAKTADAWLADRTVRGTDDLQGQAFDLGEETPWQETVEGARVLDEVAAVYERYLHTTRENVTALTLWTVYAHAFDVFGVSPILIVSSPTKRCGKTSTMVPLRRLAPRSLLSSNITPAALFRSVEAWRPTLLIDEADSFMRMPDELRGILNAGHTRDTAFTVRVEGEANEPRLFSTWAPKAIAAIGRLPDTIEDRGIRVVLSRKPTRVTTEDAFDSEAVAAVCDPVRRRVARYVLDHLPEFAIAIPERPPGMDDRAWNNWKPLLAIAAVVGAHWSERGRSSSIAQYQSADSETEDVGTLLLRHAWEVLREVETISTAELLAQLVEQEEGPWARWWAKDVREGELRAPGARLAKILQPFGIKPKQLWLAGGKTRGYARDDFLSAASTYLESDGSDGVDGRAGTSKQLGFTDPTVSIDSQRSGAYRGTSL